MLIASNNSFPGYRYFFRGMVVKNFRDIMNAGYIPFNNEGSVKSELEWCVLLLKNYENEINDFLILKKVMNPHCLKVTLMLQRVY